MENLIDEIFDLQLNNIIPVGISITYDRVKDKYYVEDDEAYVEGESLEKALTTYKQLLLERNNY